MDEIVANQVADFYDAEWQQAGSPRAGLVRLEADRAALALLEPLAGQRVLDIGAGAGEQAAMLAHAGATVVALDLTGSSLVRVRTRCAGSGLRCLLVRADAQRLPFRAAAFDRVAAFSMLMFLDPGRTLAEMARVLRPDGLAAAVEPLSGNPLLRLYRAARRRYAGLARWLGRDELAEHFRRRFVITASHGFYLLPLGGLLSTGRARERWQRGETVLTRALPFLRRYSWILVIAGRRR